MKYIKKFEEVISIELDDESKRFVLMNSLERGKVQTVKDILKNGVDPNSLGVYNFPILLGESIKNRPNLEIIQAIIDAGADVNFYVGDNTPIIVLIIKEVKSNTNKGILLEIIRKMVKAGANLHLRENSWLNHNFFDAVNLMVERNYLTKAFFDKVINVIKVESPEQYEHYLMDIKVKKYNL